MNNDHIDHRLTFCQRAAHSLSTALIVRGGLAVNPSVPSKKGKAAANLPSLPTPVKRHAAVRGPCGSVGCGAVDATRSV
eukprot:9869287-Alexandrium_andersonii.AAC.1